MSPVLPPPQVCGMMVWILVGGTDYFRLSALCWVMFVSILFWILTVCLFIIYLTGAHNRITYIPWTLLVTHIHTQYTHNTETLCSYSLVKFISVTLRVESVFSAPLASHLCFYLFQSLCFNCSAALLYLLAAVVDALTVDWAVRGRHNYNCWAASAVSVSTITLANMCSMQ